MKTRSRIFLSSITVAFFWIVSAVRADTSSFDFEKLKCRDNLSQTPLGNSGRWSLEKLLSLTGDEGVALWRSLPAPSVKEMSGQYLGLRPSAGNTKLIDNAILFNEKAASGYWLGKTFRPLSATSGEGYNRVRFFGGRIAKVARMATRVDKSLVDGKPSYILDYSAFHNGNGVDEIRKLDDSIYLGVLTLDEGRGRRTKADFFILIGPNDDWSPYEAPRR